ncbi:MAG: pyruvate kinase [Methylococcaceae bacterium]
MSRRTKIVATLGPATDEPGVLERVLRAGVDVVRLNFSHGDVDTHKWRAECVRNLSKEIGRHVAILADLQGPKIRIARFKDDGKIRLAVGARFDLDVHFSPDQGDDHQVGCHYADLPRDVAPSDVLLLDDGRIVLEVVSIEGGRVSCKVVIGGELSSYKGINKQGGGLSAAALTDKDRSDIKTAAEIDADFLAVSFPRTADDIKEARVLLRAAGGDAGIVAKIERSEALEPGVIEAIIDASDAIMVARGDLGVEIGDARLPWVQKDLIKMARSRDRAVITATQMMESMILNPMPTRAEVFDVANAVIDGTDAVMLSAETASGQFPDKAVESMHRVCLQAETHPILQHSHHRIDETFDRVDEAIAMAAMYVANHLPVKAIGALTETGYTPLWMSRISSGIPIYAMTRHEKTCRKVTLYRGVYPMSFDAPGDVDEAGLHRLIIDEFVKRNLLKKGDLVVLTKGDTCGVRGSTNAMKIAKVGE